MKRLEWQTFPRLLAIAEIGWTLKEKKNFKSFKKRIESFFNRLDLFDINYASKKEMNPWFLKRFFGNISFFLTGIYFLINKDFSKHEKLPY